MRWENRRSDRDRIFKTAYWRKLRQQVLDRDQHRCQICGCQLVTGQPRHPRNFECDHIGDRLDNSLTNLRALCRNCHKTRSSHQGGTSIRRHKYVPSPKLRRNRKEKHPGLL